MFRHVKQLQYTVRVAEPNPGLANLLLEQFGGPQGELAAACRYFTQGLSDDDPGRKDMPAIWGRKKSLQPGAMRSRSRRWTPMSVFS